MYRRGIDIGSSVTLSWPLWEEELLLRRKNLLAKLAGTEELSQLIWCRSLKNWLAV